MIQLHMINGHKITNGPMESLNGRLKRVLHDGYGYSNMPRFRNKVMFCINKNESINLKKLDNKVLYLTKKRL